MTPDADDFWFLPLGGCGEIGMNLNLYGHGGRWLMVDCGITFERLSANTTQIQMPDPGFIAARRERLCGLVITHAHEDHVGAVASLWPQLQCPVYTTRFTLQRGFCKFANHSATAGEAAFLICEAHYLQRVARG